MENDRITKKILYLHIPHTGGRALRIFLWKKNLIENPEGHGKIIYIHGTYGIDKTKQKFQTEDIYSELDIYFVLRNPFERIIGEFLHYSNLLNTNGMIGHLWLHQIHKYNPTFNPLNPYEYMNLEITKNLCCKFLLLRKDFNCPIDDEEFNILLENLSKIKYDIYQTPLNHKNLCNMLHIDEHVFSEELSKVDLHEIAPQMQKTFKNVDPEIRNSLLQDCSLLDIIKNNNIYDFKLFTILTK